MDQFQKAVARRPDLVEARVQLATMLLEAGSPEQALPLAEGALRFDSTHLPAHLVLGDVYRLQSKYAEAKQRFDYVVSKDASLPQVHYNLGLLFLRGQGKPENPHRAFQHIQYAAEKGVAEAQYDLAALYQHGEGVTSDALEAARWNARVLRIDPASVVIGGVDGEATLPTTFVYVMTGFAPMVDLLRDAGVPIDPITGIPRHDPETLETSVPGLFIAGVVVAGFDANKVFIENGRYHGDRIVARLVGADVPAEPRLSAELDS